MNCGRSKIKSASLFLGPGVVVDVNEIEIVSAQVGVGGDERTKHVLISVAPFVIPVEAIPSPHGGNSKIRCAGKWDVVTNETNRIYRVVDQNAFLKYDGLPANRETIIDRFDAGLIKSRKKAPQVTLEE